MRIDDYIRKRISTELHRSGQTNASFAQGIGKSPGWVTNLLNGKLEKLSDRTASQIEEFLDFNFFIADESGTSALSKKLKAMCGDCDYSEILLSLVDHRDKKMSSLEKEGKQFYELRLKKLRDVTKNKSLCLALAKEIRTLVEVTKDEILLPTLITFVEDALKFP